MTEFMAKMRNRRNKDAERATNEQKEVWNKQERICNGIQLLLTI